MAKDDKTDYRAGRRCYTWQGYHIPGCWGCVIGGHKCCTCESPRREEVIEKLNMLERRLAGVEGKL